MGSEGSKSSVVYDGFCFALREWDIAKSKVVCALGLYCGLSEK